jgi:hypothetical protein
MSRYKNPYK